MRFGGHQTFAIRDGWLYKGLRLVFEDPQRLAGPDLADWLGVGRNMAKSIYHWLLATGLAAKDPAGGRQTRLLRPTDFGKLVWQRDRYFLLPGTWWAIHLRLVAQPKHAYSWTWFFNVFSAARFERPVCVEALRRHIASTGGRVPVSRTLERDLACLLRSYAVSVPRRVGDPEDIMECPLSELGLMLHSRQTGFYHRNRGLKPIPFELFGYALAVGRGGTRRRRPPPASSEPLDRSLTELAHEPGAPGRVFALTSEALYELTAGYEAQGLVRLDGLAGERIVRVPSRSASDWLTSYYEAENLAETEAALAA